MFKHILVATDGSALSRKSGLKAVKFAKSLGAKVTGFTAVPNYYSEVYFEYEYVSSAHMLTKAEYREQAEKVANKRLAVIESAAKAARVKYQSYIIYNDFPAEAIVKAARAKRCDLIIMASHGRRGLSRLLLGSETTKVLVQSKIPILIYR